MLKELRATASSLLVSLLFRGPKAPAPAASVVEPAPVAVAGQELEEPLEVAPAAPVADLPPGRCVIIPHTGDKPDALSVDLHTAVLAVLQRPTHRELVDLRDPMDVVTLRREGPTGPTFATVVRWYAAGERPIAELMAEPPPLPPLSDEPITRMDAGVAYQAPAARSVGA